MRSLLALALSSAFLVAGCSGTGASSKAAKPSTAPRSASQRQAYVASPAKHFKALSEAKKREAEAEKAEQAEKAGQAPKVRGSGRPAVTAVTPVSRPGSVGRGFPEPAAAVAAPAACPAPSGPAPCGPTSVDPCAGGRCGVPQPAFCCDPCAGGKCGIPQPAWDCSGR